MRNRADNGAGDEEREENGVFVAFEGEIFAEAGDVGVCEGLAVEVVEEVGGAAICLVIQISIYFQQVFVWMDGNRTMIKTSDQQKHEC
jgi:hypothetical protein